MMRALWTGASGMKAQQTNVDTIANNLANVNTVGYKSQSTQFKSLYTKPFVQRRQQQTEKINLRQHRWVWVQEWHLPIQTIHREPCRRMPARRHCAFPVPAFSQCVVQTMEPIIPEAVILHGHWIIWAIVFWLHLRDRKSWIIRAIRSCCRMALRAMRFPLERMVLWHIRQQTAPIYRPGSRWHCTSSTIQKDWKRPGTAF